MDPTWTSLRRLGACSEAIEWASEYPSLEAAWAACERGDWMLWLAGRVSGPPESESRRRLVAAACECARLSLPVWERRYPEDRAPHVAIETAERWARGEATLAEVWAAAAAAYSAYVAAYAAASAADSASAAYAASSAASAADAAYAAAYAAYAVAYAAANADSAADSAVAYAAYASDAYASDAAFAARVRVLRECADIVRRHYPEPPAIEEE